MEKVLVVEDEPSILRVVKSYLELAGYHVLAAENGHSALQLFQKSDPDLVVLDLMLPDMSGEEVCKTIRETSKIPILMLTAKTAEDDKINGLVIGADDYVTKPFSPRELSARVMSLLRRAGASDRATSEVLRFAEGKLEIDPERYEVRLEGQELTLTPIEFQLLAILARSPGRVYSRLELVNLIQGNAYEGYERTMDVHVKNLRHKLGDRPKDPQFIGTVFGIGYKFLVSRDV